MRLIVIAGQTVAVVTGVQPLGPWERNTLRIAQADIQSLKTGLNHTKRSQGMQSELHGGINKASLHPDIAIR